MSDKKTKIVRVNWTAHTLVEASVLVEMPVDADPDDHLTAVYDAIDGDDFQPDNDVWDKGSGRFEDAEPDEIVADFFLDVDGQVRVND